MRRIGTALVVLLMCAACGDNSQPTLNHDRLVANIGKWADKQGVSNAHVSCPDDVAIKAGSTFHCIVRARGQTVRLVVTIENDDGYVTWQTG